MTKSLRSFWPLLALLAVSADTPDDATRRGNAAFTRGDYEAALAWYERAEERTTDPGLVAFNEAAALYRLGRYRDAELHYYRCREDAAGPRLTRTLFGLGNCLVQQSQGKNARLLGQAIRAYEESLSQGETEADLADDARANLELAKRLLLQAQTSAANKPPGTDNNPDNPPDSKAADTQPDDAGNDRAATQPSGKARNPATPRDGQGNPTVVDQTTPGKGNLPPVPDADEPTPLAPEDAAEHVRRAAARIAREQHEHRLRTAPPVSSKVKDW